jgi:hypothetical protein
MTQINRQDKLDQLVELVALGNHVDTACAAVGIGTRSYWRWLVTANEVEARIASEPDADDLRAALLRGEQVLDLTDMQCRAWVFGHRIARAQAKSEAYTVAVIRQAQPRHWKAAMIFLERRFPDKWRRRRLIGPDSDAKPVESEPIDESALLADPEGVKILHEVLRLAAAAEQPKDELAEAQKDIGSNKLLAEWHRPAR